MGIYDRPYLQEDDRNSWTPRSMVVSLIIINVVIWLAGAFSDNNAPAQWLALWSDLFRRPWDCWQLVTYGFVHDAAIGHVLFNMLGLYFFGRDIEDVYGPWEFLRLYLVSIVVAGLAWVAMTAVELPADARPIPLVGASGGVMAIVVLYALHFPRRLIYFWGVFPIQAWVLCTVYVGLDVLGVLAPSQDNRVANVAHLGGAAFAFAYYRTKINFGRFVPSGMKDLRRLFRPKLRIHDPGEDSADLGRQVDTILEKISREGESSLTKKERRTLEEASKRYQRRRQ